MTNKKMKTTAEIFADRVLDRFQSSEALIAADDVIFEIVEKTNQIIQKKGVEDFGVLAEALEVLAREARETHTELHQAIQEQEAAVSHGKESRELWQQWKSMAGNDAMVIKEIKNVWFKLSPDMLLDHLETVENEPAQKAVEKLKTTNQRKYAFLARLFWPGLGEKSDETN